MPIISYPFTTPANYTYNTSDIEVAGNVAQLARQVSGGQIFNQPFNDDTGFIYDNTKVEFVGGLAQQKDQKPLGALFFAPFTIDENPVWGNTASGNLVGGASVSGGVVDLTGQTTKEWNHSQVGNWDSFGSGGQIGTVRFDVVVNWATGNPPSSQNILEGSSSNNNNNALLVKVRTSGDISIQIFNNTGGSFLFVTGALSWINGQRYTIEVDYDTTDTTRVFRDGVLLKSFNTASITTDNTNKSTCYWARTGTCDLFLDNVLWFSTIQHTVSHTPEPIPAETVYFLSNIDLPIFSYTGVGFQISLDGFSVIELGTPRYTVQVDANGYMYWTGSVWASSNGAYAQANTATDINNNLPLFPGMTNTLTSSIRVHFDDADTQSNVDNLALTYTGSTIYTTTNPVIVPNTSISLDAISAFVATITGIGGDAVRFTLQLDGQDVYWDGATWVNADGTYAQTNDLATIQTNLSAWVGRGNVLIKVFLHTNDGSTTPNIDLLDITYDFFGGASTPENICTVWGYLFDAEDNPIVGSTIDVRPTKYGVVDEKILGVLTKKVITDSTGYWEFKLIETDSILDAAFGYIFRFYDGVNRDFISKRYVPNLISENFNNLVVIP